MLVLRKSRLDELYRISLEDIIIDYLFVVILPLVVSVTFGDPARTGDKFVKDWFKANAHVLTRGTRTFYLFTDS